jgi:molybdopterin molybdotransferase
LLKAGAVIHPGVVGALATIGKKRIRVFRKPDVSLIVTGNELVPAGKKLKPGQIYDSNSWTLVSALISMGVKPVRITHVRDNRNQLKNIISKNTNTVDAVILTGGVSVGDYDFVKIILKGLGVQKLFWKVSQKPGKPIYVGRKGKTFFFALPGNPASAFVCFYEYVFPCLKKMMGYHRPFLKRIGAHLNSCIHPDRHKTLFLKAIVSVRRRRLYLTLSKRQGSHMLTSFSEANGLAVIRKGRNELKKGHRIELDILPYLESAYL